MWAAAAFFSADGLPSGEREGAVERLMADMPLGPPSGDLSRDAFAVWLHAPRRDPVTPAWEVLRDAVWMRVAQGDLARADLDTWHLVQRAFYREAGPAWRCYRQGAFEALLAGQAREGCQDGLWPAQPSVLGRDPLVTNALAVAMLEFEYRCQRVEGR